MIFDNWMLGLSIVMAITLPIAMFLTVIIVLGFMWALKLFIALVVTYKKLTKKE